MKLNNKGFAITTILYGTMVLFLMLSVASLGIMSTYKIRMDKLINEEDGAECIVSGECVDSLTCSLSVDGQKRVVISTSSTNLATNPYSFDGGSSWQASNVKKVSVNSQSGSLAIKMRDNSGNTADCGTVNVTMRKKVKSKCTAASWDDSVGAFSGKRTLTLTSKSAILSTCSGAAEGYTFSDYDPGTSFCYDNYGITSDCTEYIYSKYLSCTTRYTYPTEWVTECENSGCSRATLITCSESYTVTIG